AHHDEAVARMRLALEPGTRRLVSAVNYTADMALAQRAAAVRANEPEAAGRLCHRDRDRMPNAAAGRQYGWRASTKESSGPTPISIRLPRAVPPPFGADQDTSLRSKQPVWFCGHRARADF